MSAFVVSLLFAFGASGFIWTKIGHRTGNADPKSVLMTTAVVGVIVFVVFFTMMKFVLNIH